MELKKYASICINSGIIIALLLRDGVYIGTEKYVIRGGNYGL